MIYKDGVLKIGAKPENVLVALLKNESSTQNYRNCISGSFQWQNQANCIIGGWGKMHNNLSAHGWLGRPDTVIWCDKSYHMHIGNYTCLPTDVIQHMLWCISGMGLGNYYNPTEQGYARFFQGGKYYNYSDVCRKTNHTALAFLDEGYVYGFYFKNKTAKQINQFMLDNRLNNSILLDGGHVASCNTDVYKTNVKQKQHNIIQFVQR